MTTFVAGPLSRGLHGRISVPGDKSISHRALLLAALAEGRSELSGLSTGQDVACTTRAIEQFGARVDARRSVVVDGGRSRLHEPRDVIDVGNSGTAIRLLAGWACGIDGLAILAGDESIAKRPMRRVVEPLRQMGARIDGRDGGALPPLAIRGGGLHGIDYHLPLPSAQVKGAILLAGVAADGVTTVVEDLPTRLHSEEMLAMFGADITWAAGRATVRRSALEPMHLDVPGDPSQAAFWIVGACVTPGSEVTVDHVYIGPGRAGFLDVLDRMGADVEILEKDDRSSTATLRARFGPLKGTDVGGAEVPGLIDEIPVLAVAAAYADGVTRFADANELRVKESDRISSTVAALRAIGAQADATSDGLVVEGSGGQPLSGGHADSAGDHRVAMSMAMAAAASSEGVSIAGWDAVATSYPGFEEEYSRCG